MSGTTFDAGLPEQPAPLVFGSTQTIMINPKAPFHFDGTFKKPSHFPTDFRCHVSGRYWQTLRLPDQVVGVRLTDVGGEHDPAIELTVFSEEELTDERIGKIRDEIAWRFDLHADLSPFVNRFSRDPVLAPALDRWRGMRVSSSYSLYEFLAVTTVLQNTTVRRSTQMLRTLFGRFGRRVLFDDKELWSFWPAESVAAAGEAELRALKIGYRAKTLDRVARSTVAGEIDVTEIRRLPREAQRKAILSIYGVGPASVAYILFEILHRYDALDTLSPWEQKIYSRLLFSSELVPVGEIVAETERRWGPWRMLAAHYVFEDLFQRHQEEPIPWLTELIRL